MDLRKIPLDLLKSSSHLFVLADVLKYKLGFAPPKKQESQLIINKRSWELSAIILVNTNRYFRPWTLILSFFMDYWPHLLTQIYVTTLEHGLGKICTKLTNVLLFFLLNFHINHENVSTRRPCSIQKKLVFPTKALVVSFKK